MSLTLTLRGLMCARSLSPAAGTPAKPEPFSFWTNACTWVAFFCAGTREKSMHRICHRPFAAGFFISIFCNLHIMYLFLIYPLSNQYWLQIAEQDGFSWTSSPRWWGGTTECQYLHDRATTHYSASSLLRGKTKRDTSSLQLSGGSYTETKGCTFSRW